MRADSLLAILGMALATYAARAGGLWLVGRVNLSPRVGRCLRHLPGAVLVALVVPAALSGGVAGLIGAVATAAVAARTGNLLLSAAVGVAAVWLLRALD